MLEQPILKQLILAAYSFKELAITFFPPGNRSKKHSYIPQARDKGKERAESRERNKKNFSRAGIFFFSKFNFFSGADE